jgi:hypothetical protein
VEFWVLGLRYFGEFDPSLNYMVGIWEEESLDWEEGD